MKEGIEIPYSISVVRPRLGLGPHHHTGFFQLVPLNFGIREGYWHIFNQMELQVSGTQTSTIEYPIFYPQANAPMKVIPLQNLPNFHGMTFEDPSAFMFEFDILCRGHDYTTDPQKLNLFPSTMKGATLRWFMGLGEVLLTHKQMKQDFLTKYQDYC